MSRESTPYPGYIIEVGETAAGVALSERGGYAFVAADRRFAALEARRFRTLGKVIEAACEVVGRRDAQRRRAAPPQDRRYAARAF